MSNYQVPLLDIPLLIPAVFAIAHQYETLPYGTAPKHKCGTRLMMSEVDAPTGIVCDG